MEGASLQSWSSELYSEARWFVVVAHWRSLNDFTTTLDLGMNIVLN